MLGNKHDRHVLDPEPPEPVLVLAGKHYFLGILNLGQLKGLLLGFYRFDGQVEGAVHDGEDVVADCGKLVEQDFAH